MSRPVPFFTLALALASTAVFFVFGAYDRDVLGKAAAFYADSGLAAIELPRYREYLQQSPDPEAPARLQRLERAAGPSIGRPADAAAAIELLRSDRPFERDLRADKVVAPSDPAYSDWQRERQQFDQLTGLALSERLRLSTRTWNEPWRLVTYLLLHPTTPLWLTNLLVLLVLGPFAEAAAGAGLFLLCYLGGGAFSGAASLSFSAQPAVGDWGALAALAGLLAAMFWTHSMSGRLVLSRQAVPVPGLAAPLIVIAVEAARWLLGTAAAVDVAVDGSGLAFGAALVGLFRQRDSRRARQLQAPARSADTEAPKGSALARRAQEAATRLETRRATELFRELVDLEPQQVEHLCGYLNVALLGPDETVLQDAALRLLWLRSKSHSDQLRKAYLQLTQPKVLKVLPIDEHLRLARRLVRQREDAAALKVLDAILTDSHLRELYGRQLADCLLGIYTGYARRRLTTLADTIHSRLTMYFQAPDKLGGRAPSTRRTTTLATTPLAPGNTRLPPRP